MLKVVAGPLKGRKVAVVEAQREAGRLVVSALEDGSSVGGGSGGPALERHSVAVREVETVIPRLGSGSRVVLLAGSRAGAVGALAAIHTDRYCVDVQLAHGVLLQGIEYEDVTRVQG